MEKSLELTRPERLEPPAGPPTRDAAAAKAARAPKTVAVVGVHGMGQQRRFETIQALADGIARAHGTDVRMRSRLVELPAGSDAGDRRLGRIEMTVGDVELHVYEAYWAPLTEGQITLRETMGFLFRSALRGTFRGRYRRVLFGRVRSFGYHVQTNLILGSLALLVAALFAFNAALTTVAVRSLFQAQLPVPGSPLHRPFAECAVLAIASLAILAAVLLLSHFVVRALLRSPAAGALGKALDVLVRAVVALLACGAVLLTGVSLLLSGFVGFAGMFDRWNPGVTRFLADHVFYGALGFLPAAVASSPRLAWVVWGMAALGSWGLRLFILEFVGDVAIYVGSDTLNRFFETRDRIKGRVTGVVRAIYDAYENVIVVGHSLGSVIAYDALNALIYEDGLPGSVPRRTLAKTRLFLTTGSPLNKTAYLFDTKLRGKPEERAFLATAAQPLIADRAARVFPWENVWSPADVVSGRVTYYDLDEIRAADLLDATASTPLWAHAELWEGTLMFRRILDRL